MAEKSDDTIIYGIVQNLNKFEKPDDTINEKPHVHFAYVNESKFNKIFCYFQGSVISFLRSSF